MLDAGLPKHHRRIHCNSRAPLAAPREAGRPAAQLVSSMIRGAVCVAWGTVCFLRFPQLRGKEQYISFHLDAGPKPFSPMGVRWRGAKDTVAFLFMVLG